jgi:hypothetical protein
MAQQTKSTNDPALALCQQLTEAMEEESRLAPLWSVREQAMLSAATDDKDEAVRGFDAVDGAMAELQLHIETLLVAITALRAHSIEGAAAKLRSTLRYGSPRAEPDEFPWPQIQSVIVDLERLAANDNASDGA